MSQHNYHTNINIIIKMRRMPYGPYGLDFTVHNNNNHRGRVKHFGIGPDLSDFQAMADK